MLRGRRERALGLIALPVILSSALWAMWPLAARTVPDVSVQPEQQPADTAVPLRHLDRQAFSVTIWNSPPEPELAPASAKPVQPEVRRPVRLQLIGIAHERTDAGVALRAAIYDQDADCLHMVAAGERVGPSVVLDVEPGRVRIETSGRETALELRRGEDR